MTETRGSEDGPPLGLALASLLRADSIVLLRSRVSTVLNILLPIVILVATTFGKAGTRIGGAGTIIGLALTLGLITSSLVGYSLSLAHDRDVGVLQRLRVTPAPTWMIMTSRLAVQLLSNLIAAIIVVLVGVNLHGVHLTAGRYLVVLGVAGIGGAMFLAIGQAIVALVPSASAVSAIGRILLIILVLLGILGTTGVLGDTLKVIAQWSPVGALLTVFSDLFNQVPWSVQDTNSLLACGGYILVFAVTGIRWFRWDSR